MLQLFFQKTLEDIYLGKTIITRTGKPLLVRNVELEDGYDGFEITFTDQVKGEFKKGDGLEFAFVSEEMPKIVE